MSSPIFNNGWRHACWAAVLALGLTQAACAHPVAVEPSVVISSRIGHAPVYAQIGIPGPMVLMPSPSWVYAPPPRVLHAPPVYLPAPVWGSGAGHARAHSHRHGHLHGLPHPGRGHLRHGRGGGWDGHR